MVLRVFDAVKGIGLQLKYKFVSSYHNNITAKVGSISALRNFLSPFFETFSLCKYTSLYLLADLFCYDFQRQTLKYNNFGSDWNFAIR